MLIGSRWSDVGVICHPGSGNGSRESSAISYGHARSIPSSFSTTFRETFRLHHSASFAIVLLYIFVRLSSFLAYLLGARLLSFCFIVGPRGNTRHAVRTSLRTIRTLGERIGDGVDKSYATGIRPRSQPCLATCCPTTGRRWIRSLLHSPP